MQYPRARCGCAAVLAVMLAGCAAGCTGSPPPATGARPASPASRAGGRQTRPAPAGPGVRRTVLLGYSVQRRRITATETGDPDGPARALIVGCIDGNEPAGIAIATNLADSPPPTGTDLWIIPDLNPDGVAAATLGNSHGVDLNRNFPHQWQPLGPSGSASYAGPGPLSEPESRIAAALVRRLRPRLTIYYHQPLTVVDDSEGPRATERRYARLTGLPLRPLTDYPGSAAGWQDALLGPTAFVVELPPGPLAPASVRRYATAIDAVLPHD
jgi:murein peptide amidase A